MPIARFEMPDGRIARFEVPDGTSPEEAHGIITRFLGAGGEMQKGETVAQKEVSNLQSVTTPELIAANPIARAAVGAASPILGVMEQIGMTSPEGRRQLQAMQARGNEALGLGLGGAVSEIGGAILSPAFLGAAKAMPAAANLGQRASQGAALGALGGLTTPENQMSNAAVGAALGGAIPPIMALGGKGASIASSFVPSIRKENFYKAAAGDKAEEIIDLLRRNEQIVPGSMPTAGQAASPAGRAEFSAIQAAAARGAPSQYAARTDEQSAAQLASLRSVGKDSKELGEAIKARSDASGPLYKAARESQEPVNVKPVVEKINELLRTNPGNQELVTELTAIKKGLLADPKSETLRTNAQEIVSSIDGLKARMADEKNKFIGGALDDIKKRLQDAVPGYEKANLKFREMSQPVNQMQVGQYLEGVATPTGYKPGAGTPLRESRFLEAVRKSTDVAGDDAAKRAADLFAKRATGSPRFRELTEALDDDAIKAVGDVAKDFVRNRQYIEQALRGAESTPELKSKAKLPNLLMREAMVMNAIIGKAEGRINEKLAAEIAVEMLNPPGVAENLHRAARRASMNKARADALSAWALTMTPGMTNQAGQ